MTKEITCNTATKLSSQMEISTILPSSWLLPTLFLLLSIFLYTLKSKKPSMSAPIKPPPNPPKLPVIGNLHHLIGKPSRHEALWELSKEFGPVMQFYIGSTPFLIISSSAMAKQVLKTQDHLFCSRTVFNATKRLTYNGLDIAFSPYSSHWKEMKKILAFEFLGAKRAKQFHQALVDEIEIMRQSLSVSTTEVNLSTFLFNVIKGMTCRVAFGNNYKEEARKGPSLEVMLANTMEVFNGSLGDSFPWLGTIIDYFSGFNGKLDNCFGNLNTYIEGILDQHGNHETGKRSDGEKDFVDTILELASDANTSEYRLTKNDMKALVMDVLTGGIDTTVVTLIWTMAEIARNGRVLQKLQNEIRMCTGRIEKVKELDITKMKYLKMVVKETLRLHPPAPLLVPHATISQCKIGGYDVLPNTTVLINAWGMGRDPEIWGLNAAEFYPERFENLEVDYGGESFEMIPFGKGRRSCPAMNRAPGNLELVIANLVYWFDWDANENLNMEEEGALVARKKLPLLLVPKKHNWED